MIHGLNVAANAKLCGELMTGKRRKLDERKLCKTSHQKEREIKKKKK
jgi:hypothetical protein